MNTPKTDSNVVWKFDDQGKFEGFVPADFARQLETQVQELRGALLDLVAHDEFNRREGSASYAKGSPVDKYWATARAVLERTK